MRVRIQYMKINYGFAAYDTAPFIICRDNIMKDLTPKIMVMISIALVIGFILILMLIPFFQPYITILLDDTLLSDYLSGIIFRCIILLLSISLLINIELQKFAGLIIQINMNKSKILIIPLLIIGMFLFFLPYDNLISCPIFFSFILYQISIGFAEEFTMRGLLLPLLIKIFHNKKYSIYYGIIISSIVFALLHYLSFFSGSQTFESATNQVVFALGIGMCFGSLMLISNNLIIISLLHSLVNIVGQFNTITNNGCQIPQSENTTVITFNFIYIISTVLIVISVFLLRNVDKRSIEIE